jgi:MGT family glycosyltransferase
VADDVLTALERNPVDAALVDCMLGAALCATECMRVTTAAYVHCLYQPWHETWGTFVLDVQGVRAQLGLAALDPESPKQLLRPVALVPVFAPEGFDFPLGEPDERVRYVGPVFDPTAPPSWEPPWPPHNDDPLVVISFSTTYQHQEKALQTVLDAVADLPVRALMTLGPEVETGEFNAPPNVVAEAWVDHASVLPYASLVITHAGLGTVLASLAHGIPLVCLPGGREQPFNAERVEAVGAGRTVSADADTTAVRCAIAETLSDAGYRIAATRIAATIAAQTARDQAVVEVERLLQ